MSLEILFLQPLDFPPVFFRPFTNGILNPFYETPCSRDSNGHPGTLYFPWWPSPSYYHRRILRWKPAYTRLRELRKY